MTQVVVLTPEALSDALRATLTSVLGELDLRASQISPWLTAKETAEYLRCSVDRVYESARAGKLPSHREGGRLLFNRRELDQWILDA